MTPELEPGLFGKFLDWAVAGVGGLVGIVWTFLKADINRAHTGNEKALKHIEDLYQAAEDDRKITRDLLDTHSHRMNDTMHMNQREIMRAISELKK